MKIFTAKFKYYVIGFAGVLIIFILIYYFIYDIWGPRYPSKLAYWRYSIFYKLTKCDGKIKNFEDKNVRFSHIDFGGVKAHKTYESANSFRYKIGSSNPKGMPGIIILIRRHQEAM